MEIPVNNANAVIYARYSSDKQNEQSIEGQIRVIKEYALKNNIPIIDAYIDRAQTGRSDDRPQFQKMIADSTKREFGYVLVYKFDRFSRDRLNSLLYKRELRMNGVKVVSATEYISDNSQGILFESMIDGYAEYYSAELAEKVRRGNRESRLKGQFTGGPRPYGYNIVNKKCIIKEDEAEVIKKVFEDAANLKTYKSIAEELNSKGFRHNGKDFDDKFISRILTNTKYYGIATICGEEYDNIFPAIISKDTFDRAKQSSEFNKSRCSHFRTDVTYMLTSKIFCGYCESSVVGESGKGRHGIRYYYYTCCNKKKKGVKCALVNVKKDYLEDFIVNGVKDAILHSDKLTEIAGYLSEAYNEAAEDDPMIEINHKALLTNKKEIDNIMNIFKAGFVNDTLKEELTRLDEEKKKLEAEKEKLLLKSKTKIDSTEALGFLVSLLSEEDNSFEYKQMIIDRFIRKIYLFNDKVAIHLFPSPNQTIYQMTNISSKEAETKIVYISEDYSLYYQGGSLVLELYRK